MRNIVHEMMFFFIYGYNSQKEIWVAILTCTKKLDQDNHFTTSSIKRTIKLLYQFLLGIKAINIKHIYVNLSVKVFISRVI